MDERAQRLTDLGSHLGLRVEGDGDFAIAGLAALESAGPGDLSFVRSQALLGAARALEPVRAP